MKLIVAADIHGFYSKWCKIKDLLEEDDILGIAGDLFDTKYGSYSEPDYNPDKIREDFLKTSNTIYYAYGNCDHSGYLPGFDYHCRFKVFGYEIVMTHGHINPPVTSETDILIKGHSHRRLLEKKDGMVHVNPGSVILPRDGVPGYGIITEHTIKLFDMNHITLSEYKLNMPVIDYKQIFTNKNG